jgi:hypothetical protein
MANTELDKSIALVQFLSGIATQIALGHMPKLIKYLEADGMAIDTIQQMDGIRTHINTIRTNTNLYTLQTTNQSLDVRANYEHYRENLHQMDEAIGTLNMLVGQLVLHSELSHLPDIQQAMTAIMQMNTEAHALLRQNADWRVLFERDQN